MRLHIENYTLNDDTGLLTPNVKSQYAKELGRRFRIHLDGSLYLTSKVLISAELNIRGNSLNISEATDEEYNAVLFIKAFDEPIIVDPDHTTADVIRTDHLISVGHVVAEILPGETLTVILPHTHNVHTYQYDGEHVKLISSHVKSTA